MVVGSIPIAHPSPLGRDGRLAPVAQRIEHRPPEPRVGGSNPLRRACLSFSRLAVLCVFLPAFILFIPAAANAQGPYLRAYHAPEIEAAGGGWWHEPSGNVSWGGGPLDFRRDLNFSDEADIDARLKVHLPAAWLPDMYMMATFLKLQGENTLNQSFVFDQQFRPGQPFDARIKLHHFDIAGVYSLVPAKERGLFNAQAGVNLRVIHLEATMTQGTVSSTFKDTYAVPLIYLGGRFSASSLLRIEAEARGMEFSVERYLDLIGRVKFFVAKPLFLATGYRYERMKISRHDFHLDSGFAGPFVEAGFDL